MSDTLEWPQLCPFCFSPKEETTMKTAFYQCGSLHPVGQDFIQSTVCKRDVEMASLKSELAASQKECEQLKADLEAKIGVMRP